MSFALRGVVASKLANICFALRGRTLGEPLVLIRPLRATIASLDKIFFQLSLDKTTSWRNMMKQLKCSIHERIEQSSFRATGGTCEGVSTLLSVIIATLTTLKNP